MTIYNMKTTTCIDNEVFDSQDYKATLLVHYVK